MIQNSKQSSEIETSQIDAPMTDTETIVEETSLDTSSMGKTTP